MLSNIKLTDQSEAEVASYTYDAWGNILSSSGTMAGENPYRYAGYRYDSDINLYYLMARYYNPETGRFLSKDPIPDAVNDYIYAGNNPVNYVDPAGERSDPYNGRMSTGGGGPRISFNFTAPKIKTSIYGGLKYAANYGINSYNKLKNALKGTGLEAHHIIEQRFAKSLGLNPNNMLSVAVTKAEHQVYTNRWRKYIPYGTDYEKLSRDYIWEVAKKVYYDAPKLLEAAKKTLFQ